MKAKIFMPKYMIDFKCVSSNCTDTCCAGWDINIDLDTYDKYHNSTGDLNKLLEGKYIENKYEHDFFNKGFMVLKDESRCPFLNEEMLCDIHGRIGEENLCITCRSYPRVFNLVDNIYEKSGLPSCNEICIKAFLNKDKMEFVEVEESIEGKDTEIRRIIDSEAFDGTESLLQYFWEIRVISINIIQLRSLSIEERLISLKNFYKNIENMYNASDFDSIEELLEGLSEEDADYDFLKGESFKSDKELYIHLAKDELLNNIRSLKLKECVKEFKSAKLNKDDIEKYSDILNDFSYIIENYLVNQIFKDLIPFNKGEGLVESVNALINSYRIIKLYAIGIILNSGADASEEIIIRVIQALSKDIEHNKVFKEILQLDI